MDEEIMSFDQTVENFRRNPRQGTYSTMLNELVAAIASGASVQAVVVAEKDEKGPLVRLRRLTAGDKKTFSFFTTTDKAKVSPFHTDFVQMRLGEVLAQTLREPGVAGLVINPGERTDVMIPRQVLVMVREAVKNLENMKGEEQSGKL